MKVLGQRQKTAAGIYNYQQKNLHSKIREVGQRLCEEICDEILIVAL